MTSINYYAVLGVVPGTEDVVIRAAYRALELKSVGELRARYMAIYQSFAKTSEQFFTS